MQSVFCLCLFALTGWRTAVILDIGPIKTGIVRKTALGCVNVGGAFTGLNQLFGFDQPLCCDVLPDCGAGSVFEQTAKLCFAEIEFFANIIQTDRLVQILVDIPDHPVLRSVNIGILLTACQMDVLHFVEQGNQTGKDIDPAVAGALHHAVEIMLAAAV